MSCQAHNLWHGFWHEQNNEGILWPRECDLTSDLVKGIPGQSFGHIKIVFCLSCLICCGWSFSCNKDRVCVSKSKKGPSASLLAWAAFVPRPAQAAGGYSLICFLLLIDGYAKFYLFYCGTQCHDTPGWEIPHRIFQIVKNKCQATSIGVRVGVRGISGASTGMVNVGLLHCSGNVARQRVWYAVPACVGYLLHLFLKCSLLQLQRVRSDATDKSWFSSLWLM